jgi:hypothetical protein
MGGNTSAHVHANTHKLAVSCRTGAAAAAGPAAFSSTTARHAQTSTPSPSNTCSQPKHSSWTSYPHKWHKKGADTRPSTHLPVLLSGPLLSQPRLNGQPHRGLQPRKGEVAGGAALHGHRQRDGARVALPRKALQRGAAGGPQVQTQQPGNLVVGLPCRGGREGTDWRHGMRRPQRRDPPCHMTRLRARAATAGGEAVHSAAQESSKLLASLGTRGPDTVEQRELCGIMPWPAAELLAGRAAHPCSCASRQQGTGIH